MTLQPYKPRTVLVTGARGNLGGKLIEAFARTAWCERIIGVDLHDDPAGFSPEARSRERGSWRLVHRGRHR